MKIIITTEVDDRIGVTEALIIEDSEVEPFVEGWMEEDEDAIFDPVSPEVLDWDGKSKFIAVILADDYEGGKIVFHGEQFECEDEADKAAEALEEKLREDGEIEDHWDCMTWGLPLRIRKSEGKYDAMFRED